MRLRMQRSGGIGMCEWEPAKGAHADVFAFFPVRGHLAHAHPDAGKTPVFPDWRMSASLNSYTHVGMPYEGCSHGVE